MQAEIITIGDEILIGQIIDTNSAWIAQKLNDIGINVAQITSISDNKDHIIKALDDAFDRANLILVTGGLGPTRDDITKSTLSEYFNTPLQINQEVLVHIEKLMTARNVSMNELNRKQAELPVGCRIINNSCGTAAGMWFEKKEKVLVSMPGVPFEMKAMMEGQILNSLRNSFNLPSIYHKTIIIQGIAESSLALQIEQWESDLPSFMKLAYLPSPGIVRLRISAYGPDKDFLINQVHNVAEKLYSLLPEKIIGEDDETIEMIIGKLLSANHKTLSVAESCTGGNIAHKLTLIPGSSVYFKGGIVAYSNEIKQQYLNVSENLLCEHGAVSQSVVEQMAIGIAQKMQTDYSIGISGIAGPDGGTAEKPVGTVWIAVYNGKDIQSAKFQFGDNRERNITRATFSALNMLRLLILQDVQTK